VSEQSQCPWCKRMVDSSLRTCPGCGAPVGRAKKVSASGWTELPPIRDMAKLRVGDCTCQIEGTYVPVADFNLAGADDWVYFAHHVLLWKDVAVDIRRMPLKGAFKRMMAGLPVVMTEARGPGHVAFSRDEPGEMIALPLDPGRGIYVREHLFLAATQSIKYDWTTSTAWFTTRNGKETETHYPMGRFIDHFVAEEEPGLLLLHASGNVFVRELADGEDILLKPTSLVYMDAGVRTDIHLDYTPTSSWNGRRVIWLRVIGPGRVAIQSAYEPMEDNGRSVVSVSNIPNWALSAPVAPPVMRNIAPAPIPQTPAHSEMERLVRQVMVNGDVPPEAMPGLMEAAK
jgi:uncharacterized protein (AIM24 family)